jgi:replication factor A2
MSYVRVLGTLKTFGGKRHVSTQRLRPVSDPHEVYFHLLEALDVHLQATSGIVSLKDISTVVLSELLIFRLKPSDTHVGNAGAASAYTGGGATSTGHDQYASLPPIHKAIVQFIINTPHGAEGVNVAAIARHVAGQGTTGQQVA